MQNQEIQSPVNPHLNSEVAAILKPLFIKPPTETLLGQFTTPGTKLSIDKIKDKLMDEVIGAVCSDDVDIPTYLVSRLVLSRSDAQEISALKANYLELLSQISGKSITKRSDLPVFFRWLCAKHPSMIRKASQFTTLFRG